MERLAGTFQDRLVTELRLADARTIVQAEAVQRDFPPRCNARFAVQAEHPEPAYRPVSPDLCLSETLGFKHTRKVARDNTVKYHWRVLQLLPSKDRPSYAGLRVAVLERPAGELIVQYEGRTVATQEPPPRMGALWASVTAWSPGPELKRIVSSVGDHHISRSQQRRLAALEPVRIDEAAVKTAAAKKDIVSKALSPWERTPTPTQVARWKAIQQAQLKGLSLPSHRPGAGHFPRNRAQVRLRREAAHQEVQRPGTRQADSDAKIQNRRQLARGTFSFSIYTDRIAGQQQP